MYVAAEGAAVGTKDGIAVGKNTGEAVGTAVGVGVITPLQVYLKYINELDPLWRQELRLFVFVVKAPVHDADAE